MGAVLHKCQVSLQSRMCESNKAQVGRACRHIHRPCCPAPIEYKSKNTVPYRQQQSGIRVRMLQIVHHQQQRFLYLSMRASVTLSKWATLEAISQPYSRQAGRLVLHHDATQTSSLAAFGYEFDVCSVCCTRVLGTAMHSSDPDSRQADWLTMRHCPNIAG